MTLYRSFHFAALLLFSLGMARAQTDCNGYNPDVNEDNAITITDLLALLGLFEEVDADDDGVWDSVDDCVGGFDACGVCNGPGPTVWVEGSLVCPVYGCTDSAALNFSASANTEDGTCTYGPVQCGGASTVTFDGHTYALVGIGSQCWFKENLRSDSYRNGDPIPGNLSDSQWTSTTSGAQAVYNNSDANLAIYGRLYNWYAVNDARGLCPTGFHVPTDGEWTTLENFLGGSSVAGAKMKSSPADSPAWDGTNSSGFSALPGGYRYANYGFFNSGGDDGGSWWSSSASGSDYAWSRFLYSVDGFVSRYTNGRRHGFSVRCVRDE